MLTVHGLSHPGHVRKINEDSWISDPEVGLFLVADGMGGHNAGEVASQLTVETIRAFMHRTQQGDDVTWPYGIDPGLSFEANRLATAIKLANRWVFKTGESRDDYTGMGTTVVAALIVGNRLIFASVGDSRIYSFADGALTQMTVDDSWINSMMSGPNATPIPADHPMRHVLTKVVGARDQLEFQVIERPLRGGETLVFCSDGLREDVDDAAMREILAADGGVEAIAGRLLGAALNGRAPDNVTVLVVQAGT